MKKSDAVLVHEGKVRDTYSIPDYNNLLLVVSSDRISTHNIVHNSLIPKKGEVLTSLTVHWMTKIFPEFGLKNQHHLVAYGNSIFDFISKDSFDNPEDLINRAIIVERLNIIPIEFIFRSYLTGSIYEKFYSKGIKNPYGVKIESGLQKMARFNSPVFTPTEKSETDEPMVTMDVLRRYYGAYDLAKKAYISVQKILNQVGIELIDSKLEIGFNEESELVIADEVFTPDSSRFCELKSITKGVDPPWLDKQLARDEVIKIWEEKGEEGPVTFKEETIKRLTDVYLGMLDRIVSAK